MSTVLATGNKETPQDAAMAKIGLGEKLGYGAGDIASNLIWTALSMFVTYYYTDVAGLAAAAIGTMFLVARVLDAFVDVGVGAMVDKTKTKFGKARPWLLWWAIPFGISGVLLFSMPDLGPAGSLFYAYATYLLINIIYSAINIPYGVLSSLMTQDPYQRSLLNIFRMVMALVGMLIVSNGTLPLVAGLGGGKPAWTLTFAAFSAVAVILFLITFLTARERVRPAVVNKDIPLKRGLPALFRNKYWVLVLLLNTVFYGMQAVTSAVNVYYAQYLLGNKDLVGLLTIAQLVPMMLGLLALAPVIKKFGKRNVALAGMAVMAVGCLIPAIDPANVTVVIVSTVVKALGTAPLIGTIFAFAADTVDYGEWKTGMRTEGLIFSASSFGGKTGSGLGGAMVGWMLAFSGYVGGQEAVSASASHAIQFLFIYFPAILCAVLFVILWFYKLDKEYPKILAELQAIKKM
ncbi:MAG: MFS transporter [Paenibacillus macerans]|uniref:MFS transporter n=2 Tax=Paenibacillus macerans TaxID=44252 RepID=A0A6N8EME7_PAEMA|nr:MFS transporter [Paenibacillus macerans]MBS5910444.1 MFS transporter [Paenibacillus macerans]MDU7477240.1 MFS transporter [Paenibacillus macerans]MEC0138654.1 MFS transporter [Paenibacillus macerans]MEC0328302.1 MFS transporter [Paenibacillus macerans]MUG21476.1 MFS transporter [Paenibacillus macerans]